MNANFRGKGASPTNDFWHQKSRVPGLSYGEKKLPKSSTGWVGCTNVTDRRQTELRWQVANVNAISRPLKIIIYFNMSSSLQHLHLKNKINKLPSSSIMSKYDWSLQLLSEHQQPQTSETHTPLIINISFHQLAYTSPLLRFWQTKTSCHKRVTMTNAAFSTFVGKLCNWHWKDWTKQLTDGATD